MGNWASSKISLGLMLVCGRICNRLVFLNHRVSEIEIRVTEKESICVEDEIKCVEGRIEDLELQIG